MSTNFWELLQQHQGDLTRSGRTVADYLVQHAAEAQYLSISSLARECQVAEATVFRYCRALGFEGYHEMRIALAQANATGVLVNQQEPAPDADTATLCEHASALFMTAINGTQNALSPQAVEQAVALLHSARQVFCMGQGGSMAAANEICARFACITNKFRAVADSHMQVMAASLMTEQDVVRLLLRRYPRPDRDPAHRQGQRGKGHPDHPLRGLPRRKAGRPCAAVRRTGKPAGLRQHSHQGSGAVCGRGAGTAVHSGRQTRQHRSAGAHHRSAGCKAALSGCLRQNVQTKKVK